MNAESILVLGMFALGLAPLVLLLRRPRSRGGLWAALVCGGLVVALALGVEHRSSRRLLAAASPTDAPIAVHKDGYLSSQPCQACHPEQYETWHASYHRSMTAAATPEAVRGDFGHRAVTSKGLVYRLDRKGDEFWVDTEEFWNPPPADGQRRRVQRRIALVTGSHHMQVYWFAAGEGRKLQQLPIVYLFEAHRWIPREAAFLSPPTDAVRNESGRWNDTCITCHSTRGQPRLLEGAPIDSHVAEFGIACEACHGPAETHVRENHSPLRRYEHHWQGGRQGTITNPERLDARLSSQVCGQCHIVAVLRGEDFARWTIEGLPFRPGEDLDRAYVTIQYSRPETISFWKERHPDFLANRFWPDGMVRVSGREFNGLIESPCYVHGREGRRLACLSCHTMHQSEEDGRPLAAWSDDQLRPGMEGDRACLQCHEGEIRDLRAHTHHREDSSGSRCYNCHMPYTTYGLLKAIRSHQVSSPTVQESLAAGRPNACNQCHLDRTLDWTADRLNAWYGVVRPPLGEEERNVSAGVLWTLQGDAGLRALMAWSMGWEAAREAAGSDWQAAYLGPLLDDPYDAVRYIAQRSLRTLPGFERVEYDFVGPEERRHEAALRVLAQWRRGTPHREGREALLLRPDNQFEEGRLRALLGRRNDRPVELIE